MLNGSGHAATRTINIGNKFADANSRPMIKEIDGQKN